eukprot:6146030-Alexandrium_andersonii.AAC.1
MCASSGGPGAINQCTIACPGHPHWTHGDRPFTPNSLKYRSPTKWPLCDLHAGLHIAGLEYA